MKIEELKKIPLRIINELKHIKELEEETKQQLMIYRQNQNEIKELYEYLERLIKMWNNE